LSDGRIPTGEVYRGVAVHAGQQPHRVATIVRPAIDVVHEMADPRALFDYACDARNPPEARLFAEAKCQACCQMASQDRRRQPDIDLEVLQASCAGLTSLGWRDPYFYCSLLDRPDDATMPEHTRREVPLA
jgi:hypothetical protein